MAAPSANAPDDPELFEEAIEYFLDRVPLGDEEFDSLSVDEKDFAWTVASVAQADVVATVFDAIQRAVEEGTTFEEFADDVGDELEAAWNGSVANPGARLATIFRTTTQSAYGEGRYKQLSDPSVKEARPYWKFDAIEDDRTSDVCDECDGTVLPADDGWWDSHNPPLHFNCRSNVRALSEEEAADEGIDEKGPGSDADDGFGAAPSVDEDAWEPDVDDYPGEIAGELGDRLRD